MSGISANVIVIKSEDGKKKVNIKTQYKKQKIMIKKTWWNHDKKKKTKIVAVAATSTEHGGKQNENTVVAKKPTWNQDTIFNHTCGCEIEKEPPKNYILQRELWISQKIGIMM